MTQIRIETLKGLLDEYVRLVDRGEKVVFTEQGRPVALLSRIPSASGSREVWDLVSSGSANWNGGKPRGSSNPPKIRGRATADMVIEDRR